VNSHAYLFRGNSLLVPEDMPDSRAPAGIPREKITGAFADALPDAFELPPVRGSLSIGGFSVPAEWALPPG
jgi:hypothetical protein